MGYKQKANQKDVFERTNFTYAVLPLKDVREFYNQEPKEKDSYLSEDLLSIKDTLLTLISTGYRWVRSEDGYAIFELEVTTRHSA